jgi:LuxR family maltose regulon positive regulatory protein
MPQHNQSLTIIRTKLRRPPVPGDIVCRKKLHSKFEQGCRSPLSLVVAPAGYGKSTVVSHWLETCGHPSAWLSLDETDSDLRVFISYFVAAVQTLESKGCRNLLPQLLADELQPPETLAHIL